jgi:lipopolysaccharide/colanic/teichoic acid biosynthesis glycosyltransferase
MSFYLNSTLKRALDILFSIAVLPIALPCMVMASILVYLSDRGPLFFVQERVGKNSYPFKMVKIRTLKKGFSSENGKQHNAEDILIIGRWLRKLRIDELPQIWNILKGEMSWVGPRPEIEYYFTHFKGIDPSFETRQVCKPGITGLAQLNNPDATPSHSLEKLPHDLHYIQHASLGMDIRILLQSIFSVWK